MYSRGFPSVRPYCGATYSTIEPLSTVNLTVTRNAEAMVDVFGIRGSEGSSGFVSFVCQAGRSCEDPGPSKPRWKRLTCRLSRTP